MVIKYRFVLCKGLRKKKNVKSMHRHSKAFRIMSQSNYHIKALKKQKYTNRTKLLLFY